MFNGRQIELPINHESHAIHGLGFAQSWSAVRSEADLACELSLDLAGLWPFGGRVHQHIETTERTVTQTVTVEAADERFPAGVGWHPWFRRDIVPGEDARVLVGADERYELDAMIPTGRMLAVAGDYDLRGAPAVGDRQLDACYRGVSAPLRVAWGRIALTLESSANVGHTVVYTARHAVCVEPQTCAIDAFNLESRGVPAGVVIVEPGTPLTAWTRWTWHGR
jgi:aldose 1-epimerase